jgi:hypothetical protein
MLTIRHDQVTALEADLFERWMDKHLRRFFPSLCAARSVPDLGCFIRAGIEKARGYGFVEKAEMSGFIDLMLVLGEDFDRNPALPWACGLLSDPNQSPPGQSSPDQSPSDESPPAARLESLRHFAHEWLRTGTVTSSVFTAPEPAPREDEPESPDGVPAPGKDESKSADSGRPDEAGSGDMRPGARQT